MSRTTTEQNSNSPDKDFKQALLLARIFLVSHFVYWPIASLLKIPEAHAYLKLFMTLCPIVYIALLAVLLFLKKFVIRNAHDQNWTPENAYMRYSAVTQQTISVGPILGLMVVLLGGPMDQLIPYTLIAAFLSIQNFPSRSKLAAFVLDYERVGAR